MAGAPSKDFQPFCRVCGRALRRQSTRKEDAPGTVIAAVPGLCSRDYVAWRAAHAQEEKPSVEPQIDDEGFAWRTDLTPLDLQLLAAIERRYPVDSIEFKELGTAFGFRTRGGATPSTWIGGLKI